MKIKVLFISAFICLTAISANAQKIGYLNTNELLVQMKEVKSADSLLNQYAEEMQKFMLLMLWNTNPNSPTTKIMRLLGAK